MNFHLQNTGDKAEEDWFGFVALVNNSPNITDLSITDLFVSKEVIARNPKIIPDKVKSLHVVLSNAAGIVNILQACSDNLNDLKITLRFGGNTREFLMDSWFLPACMFVAVKNLQLYPDNLQLLKSHFP